MCGTEYDISNLLQLVAMELDGPPFVMVIAKINFCLGVDNHCTTKSDLLH